MGVLINGIRLTYDRRRVASHFEGRRYFAASVATRLPTVSPPINCGRLQHERRLKAVDVDTSTSERELRRAMIPVVILYDEQKIQGAARKRFVI